MKKGGLLYLVLMITLLASLLIVGCSSGSTSTTTTTQPTTTQPTTTTSTKVFNLVCGTTDPEMTTDNQIRVAWANYLKEASDGRLNIKVMAGGTAGSGSELFDNVRTGVVDMANADPGFYGGRFPLNEMFQLPFLFQVPEARAIAVVHGKLMEKYPLMADEWKDVKVWPYIGRGLNQVFNTKRPVHTMEDMNGLILRIRGSIQSEVTKLLGAVPADTPSAEVYDSVAKGVIDGSYTNYVGFAQMEKLIELCDYATECNSNAGMNVFTMNWDVWNSLPADLQKLFDDTMPEWSNAYGWAWDEVAAQNKQLTDETLKGRGFEGIYKLPQTEQDRWIAASDPVYQTWIDSVSKKVDGTTARAILDDTRAFAKEAGYTDAIVNQAKATLDKWGYQY